LSISAVKFGGAKLRLVKENFTTILSGFFEGLPKEVRSSVANVIKSAFLIEAEITKVFKSSITFSNQKGAIWIFLLNIEINDDKCDIETRNIEG
jgi:hypothetical protein